MAACILKPSRNDTSRTALAIAGGSVATISAGLAYGLAIASPATPQYEGHIQIRLDNAPASHALGSDHAPVSQADNQAASTLTGFHTSAIASSGGAPETFDPEYAKTEPFQPLEQTLEQPLEERHSEVAPEPVAEFTESDLALQALFLSSPEVIKPALEQLREQGIHLNYQEFTQHFALHPTDRQTLQVVYRGQDAQTVAQVLEAIAQAYVQQGHDCQAQVCQNFDFVQIQLEHATQRLSQLQSELAQFEQQHDLSDSHPQQHPSLGHIAASLNRQLSSTQERRTHARQQFHQTQQAMGCATDHTAALELLARSPSYRSLMEQWKQLDQRWVEAKFNSGQMRAGKVNSAADSAASRSAAIYALMPSESIEDLEEQHQLLRDQLNASVALTIKTLGLTEMPPDLRKAVVDRPQRLELLESWLLQAQQVYLLQTRQHHLTDAAKRLAPLVQQWKATEQKHQSLHQQIHLATETLERYRHQHAVLYPQVMPRQTAWQLVSSPEVAPTHESVVSKVMDWFQTPSAFPTTSHVPTSLSPASFKTDPG